MNKFEKIIGYEAVKQELKKICDVLVNENEYKKLGVSTPRGLLLYGKPGVGKTLMANAVVASSGRKTFLCRKDKPAGDFIKAIKKTFTEAKAAAPSIIFLDDMDKFANADERYPDAEEYVTVQSCIDDIKNKDIFVLATANSIRCLPDSLLRAGRFDRVIKVNNPHGRDAEQIIKYYISKKKFVGDIDISLITRIMDGRSCAELETIINEAGIYAGFDRADEITMNNFMKACLHSVYELPAEVLDVNGLGADLSDTDSDMAKIIYHEAGHATVAEVLNPGSVTLASVYSRKGQKGGFTSCNRRNIAEIYKNNSADICEALAGMAAIEQKYGISDIGASNDLEQAFELVRENVTDRCMCGFHLFSRGYSDSEKLQTNQEQAIASEVERIYRKTKEILAKNSGLFERIAEELANKGIITLNDISRIKQNCDIVPVSAA